MSDNIHFISAADLPEAEGEEVEVLCVENGELKKKAASGLGGADADIFANITITSYDVEDGSCEFSVSDEKVPTYSELYAMLMGGTAPKMNGLLTVEPWEALNVDQYSTIGCSGLGFYPEETNVIACYFGVHESFNGCLLVYEDETVEWVVFW